MALAHPFALQTLVLFGLVAAAVPASAVQIAFFGGSNIGNLSTVVGSDGLGDTWQTHNGPLLLNSNFAMSDFNAAPQAFNSLNFSNGAGSYATSFQLTINHSQQSTGFQGINSGIVASGLVNNFTVHTDPLDPATWVTWAVTYELLDAASGLFQQTSFVAPVGPLPSATVVALHRYLYQVACSCC
jgi:hypothetical protein